MAEPVPQLSRSEAIWSSDINVLIFHTSFVNLQSKQSAFLILATCIANPDCFTAQNYFIEKPNCHWQWRLDAVLIV